MPRYYFDINDGEIATGDDDGHSFADAETARRVAITTLTEIVSEALPDGANRDFTVKVRNEHGDPVFEAALSFRSGWIGAYGKDVPGASAR